MNHEVEGRKIGGEHLDQRIKVLQAEAVQHRERAAQLEGAVAELMMWRGYLKGTVRLLDEQAPKEG